LESWTPVDWLMWVGGALGGVLVVMLPIELVSLHRQGKLDRARVREMLASASPFVPTILTSGLAAAWVGWLFGTFAQLAPWKLPVNPLTVALALLGADFLYYWDHRAAHGCRLYWALTHSVHHTSPQYDQTTGLRVSALDALFTPWFYVPLVLLGFDPLLVGASLFFVVGYQQWIHTELVGRLGWLDGWLNTPANHRVHHATQPNYIDKNFGAVTVIWDRLFGTWEPEREKPSYGVTHPIGSSHVVDVHVHEARRLWRELRDTPGFSARLRLLWSTAAQRPASTTR
jgi:sterol desaturase/sphingolipid hydroxylase (fatty acid hydroxylase superfamily)